MTAQVPSAGDPAPKDGPLDLAPFVHEAQAAQDDMLDDGWARCYATDVRALVAEIRRLRALAVASVATDD